MTRDEAKAYFDRIIFGENADQELHSAAVAARMALKDTDRLDWLQGRDEIESGTWYYDPTDSKTTLREAIDREIACPSQWHDVWMEGYRANGQSAQARYLGSHYGQSFEEACREQVRTHQLGADYNSERNTVWGCRLFPTEEEARASFG